MCLVIFLSRNQLATLDMLQNELVTVHRCIQKLCHIEKVLLETVCNG